jgi:uncharacterized protein YjiS (DUF1127 family)
MAARMTCKFKEYRDMTHTFDDPRGLSREALVRKAREARDQALADLLAAAPKGVANLAAMAVRGLTRAGRSIVSGVVTAQRRRAALHEMQGLDDRMLKDIGISRGDIPFVVERQLAAARTASAGSATACDIAAFPDRQAAAASPRALLRPAA